MRKKRRIEITVETDRLLTIRNPEWTVDAWCAQCGTQTCMLTLEEAMKLTGASSREIHRLVEADIIHFSETPEGFVLICLNSLQSITNR